MAWRTGPSRSAASQGFHHQQKPTPFPLRPNTPFIQYPYPVLYTLYVVSLSFLIFCSHILLPYPSPRHLLHCPQPSYSAQIQQSSALRPPPCLAPAPRRAMCFQYSGISQHKRSLYVRTELRSKGGTMHYFNAKSSPTQIRGRNYVMHNNRLLLETGLKMKNYK